MSEGDVEKLGGVATRIIPASGKIYDITHADTNEHSQALPATLPSNTRALIIQATRIAGTGTFQTRTVSGDITTRWTVSNGSTCLWLRAVDGNFYYALTVANDDWDIYICGYITGAA